MAISGDQNARTECHRQFLCVQKMLIKRDPLRCIASLYTAIFMEAVLVCTQSNNCKVCFIVSSGGVADYDAIALMRHNRVLFTATAVLGKRISPHTLYLHINFFLSLSNKGVSDCCFAYLLFLCSILGYDWCCISSMLSTPFSCADGLTVSQTSGTSHHFCYQCPISNSRPVLDSALKTTTYTGQVFVF